MFLILSIHLRERLRHKIKVAIGRLIPATTDTSEFKRFSQCCTIGLTVQFYQHDGKKITSTCSLLHPPDCQKKEKKKNPSCGQFYWNISLACPPQGNYRPEGTVAFLCHVLLWTYNGWIQLITRFGPSMLSDRMVSRGCHWCFPLKT